MKERILFLGLVAGLFASVVFMASCNQNNHASIQVISQYTNNCGITVNLDGGGGNTVPNGGTYTFQNVGSGNHTLNFSTGVTCSSGNCGFVGGGGSGSGTSYHCNFNVSDGILYSAGVFDTGNCASVSILCPP